MEFKDGNDAWKSGLRKTRVLQQGLNVSSLLDGRHIQQYFGTDDATLVSVNYAQIFSATDKYHGKMLLGMTEASGRVKEILSDRFRWTLSGGNNEYPRVTRLVCADPRPGINNTTVDIIVDKPYFNIGDVIQPEDNRTRCLVVTPDGGASRVTRPESGFGYRYTIKLLNDDPTAFINPGYLAVGHEWNQVSSAVATESNIDGSGFHFYSVFESEGQTGQFAAKYALTDKAANRIAGAAKRGMKHAEVYDDTTGAPLDYSKLTTALWIQKENKVEATYGWLNAFDAELMNTLMQSVENALMFGQETSNNYSPEGHQILTGSGLREQLETGHTLPHNGTLDLATLENWFDSIMLHRISEENSNIVLSCGYEFRLFINAASIAA